jgi:bacillithiol system protein YtxJ
MGVFSNFFSNSNEDFSTFNWLQLQSVEQLQNIENQSNTKLQVIFKHSTRCGVSRMVIRQFEAKYKASENDIDFYYLDLLRFRSVSNAISETFQIIHQSPQIIVIKNKKVIAQDSHQGILNINLNIVK